MFKTWVEEGVLIGILFWNPRDVVSTMLWFPGSPSGDQYGNFAIVPSSLPKIGACTTPAAPVAPLSCFLPLTYTPNYSIISKATAKF